MSEEIKDTVEVTDSSISKSKAKREARAAEVKAAKAKKNFDAILGWVIGIALAAVVIAIIGMGIYTSATKTTASSDFSKGLTADGFVKGADISAVKDLSMEGMEIPFEAVDYMDDKVEAQLVQAAQQFAFYSDDASKTVEDGDTINLNYSGSVDGVQFDGGTADNQSLTIGSGSFIDNFEQQLIGSHPGDDVTVNVTFPDPYQNNPDLAGKEAVFECHVNSIYTTPEVDDEFVKEHYSDLAGSLDEFKAYLKEQGYQSNLDTYLADYITENASVSKVPSAYKKQLKSLIKYSDEQAFDQYKTYMSYYGYNTSDMSFSDYTGLSESEYEKHLKEESEKQAVMDLTYEAIFRNAGLTISDEDYEQVLNYYGSNDRDAAIAQYGEPYIKQTAIKYTVIHYLKDKANIVKGGSAE